ncbi:TPA: hypothetical protein JD889_26865, partial [Citrobacter freundii]|nr:hypothetical protein [Citrobacter freundii]
MQRATNEPKNMGAIGVNIQNAISVLFKAGVIVTQNNGITAKTIDHTQPKTTVNNSTIAHC